MTPEMIRSMEDAFGVPRQADFRFAVAPDEFNRIRNSQKDGREHDVTFYIVKEGEIVVIAKHSYPPGMYRAPSGGLRPGEDFVAGARREAMEETGCDMELERFLLATNVAFVHNRDSDRVIKWNSYVFLARYSGGDFNFSDTREIREVRLVSLSDFDTFSRIMRQSNVGGLHYRAALHDTVKQLLPRSSGQ